MQQPCQHCGYVSPTSARFCRQCGATLFVESELSGAATRNYGRQEPTPAGATTGSGHLPPSVADAIAGETERYYKAPSMPAPPAPNTAPIKSRSTPWRWIVLLLVLMMGAAIGAALMRSPGSHQDNGGEPAFPGSDLAGEVQRRQADFAREREDRIREAQDRVREATDRAREALDRQREALERAHEAAQQASEAGTAFTPTNEKLLDLSPLEYPNARVRSLIRIPGHEVLSLRTSDDFDAVAQFYQKKLGKPVIQINESWEKRLLFLSSAAPPIAVSVEMDDEHPDQLKILVLRLPFRIAKPDEPQNP